MGARESATDARSIASVYMNHREKWGDRPVNPGGRGDSFTNFGLRRLADALEPNGAHSLIVPKAGASSTHC